MLLLTLISLIVLSFIPTMDDDGGDITITGIRKTMQIVKGGDLREARGREEIEGRRRRTAPAAEGRRSELPVEFSLRGYYFLAILYDNQYDN
jgi:hypothetical protein